MQNIYEIEGTSVFSTDVLQSCGHYQPIDYPVDLTEVDVRTLTAKMARNCCIPCLERTKCFVESLPETHPKRQKSYTPIRVSAQHFVYECISYSGTSNTKKKKAIKWCLKQGWVPCSYVFEFTPNWSFSDSMWLFSNGILPDTNEIIDMCAHQSPKNIRRLMESIPQTHRMWNGIESSTVDIKQSFIIAVVLLYLFVKLNDDVHRHVLSFLGTGENLPIHKFLKINWWLL